MMIKTIRNIGAGIAILLALASPAIAGSAGYPIGATAVAASATGTTLATSATLPAVPGQTTYLCGFSVRANATSAITANTTVTGMLGGTLSFAIYIPVTNSTIGIAPLEPALGPFCLPASAANTAIVVTSPAPGAGGTVSVSAWGFTN